MLDYRLFPKVKILQLSNSFSGKLEKYFVILMNTIIFALEFKNTPMKVNN
jgi:hypothetical protein